MMKVDLVAAGDVIMISQPNYGREDTVKYYILDEWKMNLIEVSYLKAKKYQQKGHEDYYEEP